MPMAIFIFSMSSFWHFYLCNGHLAGERAKLVVSYHLLPQPPTCFRLSTHTHLRSRLHSTHFTAAASPAPKVEISLASSEREFSLTSLLESNKGHLTLFFYSFPPPTSHTTMAPSSSCITFCCHKLLFRCSKINRAETPHVCQRLIQVNVWVELGFPAFRDWSL